MKTLTLFATLLLLTSCNDALRTRKGACKTEAGESVQCNTDALTTDEARKNYYANISVPVTVGQSQLVMKEHAQDEDHDQELICDLEISAGKQFHYAIENNRKLTLKDNLSTLRFDRTGDTSLEGLLGTWVMQEKVGNVLTITKLTFKTLESITIDKNCKLK
jgi:hypothetical protein